MRTEAADVHLKKFPVLCDRVMISPQPFCSVPRLAVTLSANEHAVPAIEPSDLLLFLLCSPSFPVLSGQVTASTHLGVFSTAQTRDAVAFPSAASAAPDALPLLTVAPSQHPESRLTRLALHSNCT